MKRLFDDKSKFTLTGSLINEKTERTLLHIFQEYENIYDINDLENIILGAAFGATLTGRMLFQHKKVKR